MKYTVYDRATGLIQRRLEVPDLAALAASLADHEDCVPGDIDDSRYRLDPITLAVLELAPPPLNYRQLRRREYPPLADQLDAIWKGGAAAESMREQIMDIKRRHPKPDAAAADD